jgi:hypothetical protein
MSSQSSLISQTQCGPSGSLAVARHSIGSMKAASALGAERSFASALRFAGTVQGVYRLGTMGRKYFDPLQFPLQ